MTLINLVTFTVYGMFYVIRQLMIFNDAHQYATHSRENLRLGYTYVQQCSKPTKIILLLPRINRLRLFKFRWRDNYDKYFYVLIQVKFSSDNTFSQGLVTFTDLKLILSCNMFSPIS